MTAPLVETKSLNERVTERLHAVLGELITDADLRAVVDRGVEDFFFKPRRQENRGGYGPSYVEIPPLMTEMLDKHLKGRMEAVIEQWFKDNPEKVQQALDDALRRGVAAALIRTLDERFVSIFSGAVEVMQGRGLLPRGPNS